MLFLTNPLEITAYTSFLFVWAVNLFRVCQPDTLTKELKNKDNLSSQRERKNTVPGISVVILTENQEEKLVPLLENVLNQAYDFFEVVVVDKNSTDNTRIILENLEKRHENLQYTFIPKDTRHVSTHTLALTLGVKAAHYPWVVLLNPDFMPASDQWLSSLSEHMTTGKDFVFGTRSVSSKSSALRSFYYLNEQSRILSWAYTHPTYRCNEVNLAFRKERLLSSKDFGEYGILLSDIEQIFANRFGRPEKTAVCITPESLLLENEDCKGTNWSQKLLFLKEAEHYFKHKAWYRFCSNLRMATIWLLFWLSVVALAVSIFFQRWEATAGVVILLVVWSILRAQNLKRKARLLRIRCKGTFLPFYDLRLSCLYLKTSIHYAFQNKKIFYRKMFD